MNSDAKARAVLILALALAGQEAPTPLPQEPPPVRQRSVERRQVVPQQARVPVLRVQYVVPVHHVPVPRMAFCPPGGT